MASERLTVEMIRDKADSVIHEDGSVEIVKDEEAGKPETVPPERRGDPAIQVVEIGRGVVVGNNRRAFLVIIIVDYRRVGVLLRLLGQGFVSFGDGMRPD